MRRFILFFLILGLGIGLPSDAFAHIGDNVYLFFEIADEDLEEFDFTDGTIEEWEEIVGEPSLLPGNFIFSETVGDGAQYDPADMDFRIWLGWNATTDRFYYGVWRSDNVYINEYAGGNPGEIWRHDSISFKIDADHSGGPYQFSQDDFETEEDYKLARGSHAQMFNFIPTAPDNIVVGHTTEAGEWLVSPPFSESGGAAVGQNPTILINEAYITAFDRLIYNDPEGSVVSDLFPGKIIGFETSPSDFDTEPTAYRSFSTLSGQSGTSGESSRFVDGRLIGVSEDETAVKRNSWGRIKASFED